MHTFPMSSHERVFNIDYTLGSGRTPGVSIFDSELRCDYGFRAMMLMSLLVLLVLLVLTG